MDVQPDYTTFEPGATWLLRQSARNAATLNSRRIRLSHLLAAMSQSVEVVDLLANEGFAVEDFSKDMSMPFAAETQPPWYSTGYSASINKIFVSAAQLAHARGSKRVSTADILRSAVRNRRVRRTLGKYGPVEKLR